MIRDAIYEPTPITSCEQIYQLAVNKKSVFVKQWGKAVPAAFLINWSAG